MFTGMSTRGRSSHRLRVRRPMKLRAAGRAGEARVQIAPGRSSPRVTTEAMELDADQLRLAAELIDSGEDP